MFIGCATLSDQKIISSIPFVDMRTFCPDALAAAASDEMSGAFKDKTL
jgi:hypothetical protein